MWQILINGPGYFDTPYDLPEGDTHLGRADENDVVLTGDKVSRRHAKLKVNGGAVTIEDLGSRNGTQLNGKAFTGPASLKEGDLISVGENTLALRQPGEVEFARTEMVDASTLGETSTSNKPPPHTLDAKTAELLGQVVMSRDLRENSFLASFEQARSMSVQELQAQSANERGVQSLMLLYKVVDTLSRSNSLDTFLQQMLDMVMELAKAKTGVVLLRNVKNTFSPVVVRHGSKLEKGEVPISDGIVAEVVKKKVALCVADVRDDARFANRESVILYDVNQVVCVPMIHDGTIIGLIYLNRPAGDPSGLEGLLDLLTAIAQLSANGAQQARLKAKVQNEEKIRRALERFHAPDVVDRVVKDLGNGQQVGAKVEELVCSIVFVDICDFTGLTERINGTKVIELLNDYYRRMTRVIFSFGGTVDKFIGDSVMGIFGAPYSRGDDAVRAVRAALTMRREFLELMSTRPPEEKCGFRAAINTGQVLAGIVGSDARLEYTALGEPVNIASRLKDLAQPGQVLITKSTFDVVGERFHAVHAGERAMKKGKSEKMLVFEVLDEDLEFDTSPGSNIKP